MKSLFLSILLTLFCLTVFGANFYRIGSAGLSWKNTGSWSSTSGGASNGVDEPSSSDAVIFDTNSPATVTVDASASGASLTLSKTSLVITLNGGSITISGTMTVSIAATINKTGSETISVAGYTMTANLSGTVEVIMTGGTWSTSSGTPQCQTNLTFAGNVTISGTNRYTTGTLKYTSGTITTPTVAIQGSCTINTNGLTWTTFATTSNFTVTLTSNLQVGTFSVSGGSLTINKTTSETITVSTALTMSGAQTSGTAEIIMTNGTWSATNSSGIVFNNLTFAGNVTVSGNVYYRTGTITYSSGTITTTSSTLNLSGTTHTLNTNGMSWNNIAFIVNSQTLTLTSNLTANGLVSAATGTAPVINKTASETFTIGGGITVGSQFTGTADIYLTGGTWTMTGGNFGISNNLFLLGNVTVSGIVKKEGAALTYVSGTITVSGSTLTVSAATTFNTSGMTWNNIDFNFGGVTQTINSTLSANAITITGNLTFAGTSGFTTATLTNNDTGAGTISLKESVTYTITSSFSCNKSRLGSIVLFTSSHGTTKANILMPNNGNNSCNILASFVRIDATGGRSINTYGGTITDCINVRSFTDFQPTAN